MNYRKCCYLTNFTFAYRYKIWTLICQRFYSDTIEEKALVILSKEMYDNAYVWRLRHIVQKRTSKDFNKSVTVTGALNFSFVARDYDARIMMLFLTVISYLLSENFSDRIEIWKLKNFNIQKFKTRRYKRERTVYFIIIFCNALQEKILN